MLKKMFGLLVIASLVFVLPVVVCAEEPLIVGTTDRVTELSFANAYDMFSGHVMRNTTRGLVSLSPGDLELVPEVALSWEISPDGKEYTFYLRDDAFFWDGTQCDAAAVKWCFEVA